MPLLEINDLVTYVSVKFHWQNKEVPNLNVVHLFSGEGHIGTSK